MPLEATEKQGVPMRKLMILLVLVVSLCGIVPVSVAQTEQATADAKKFAAATTLPQLKKSKTELTQ